MLFSISQLDANLQDTRVVFFGKDHGVSPVNRSVSRFSIALRIVKTAASCQYWRSNCVCTFKSAVINHETNLSFSGQQLNG